MFWCGWIWKFENSVIVGTVTLCGLSLEQQWSDYICNLDKQNLPIAMLKRVKRSQLYKLFPEDHYFLVKKTFTSRVSWDIIVWAWLQHSLLLAQSSVCSTLGSYCRAAGLTPVKDWCRSGNFQVKAGHCSAQATINLLVCHLLLLCTTRAASL